MDSKPMVSVCMITYNHEKYIQDALHGVLMQVCDFDVELILSNDCSTDNTHGVITSFLKSHERAHWVKYTNHATNLGMIPNFMYALKQCRGKYIALCEGDDYWTDPLKLQKQVGFLESNPDYSLCFTRFKIKNNHDEMLSDDKNGHYFKDNNQHIEFDFNIFAKGWHVGTQTLVFKKNFFDINLVFKYKYFRDVYLFTELLKQGKGACLNFFGAVYRIHDGGIHSSRNELQVYKIASLCYKELYYSNTKIGALKRKYYNFNKGYIELLIKSSSFVNAFWNVLKFGIAERDLHFIKVNSLRISKIVFKKIKHKIL